ncbi:MAG TPA: hypothetical protein VM261_32355 [Kofleriaceae bacterium]|nr:hypothetical protein [Kofleriaceae bacterium]
MHRGGAQIGRYRVLQLLGHGGMGDVYLALRPHGRHVIRAEALVPEPGDIYGEVRRTLGILRAAGV